MLNIQNTQTLLQYIGGVARIQTNGIATSLVFQTVTLWPNG